MQKHIAIAGGGLAGSFLAATLLHAGFRVSWWDAPDPHTASRTAAGLVNLITGKYSARTWQGDVLTHSLRSFWEKYPSLSRFFHPEIIYRPFKTAEEANDWAAKSGREELRGIVTYHSAPRHAQQIHNPFGGIEVQHGGWLDTRGFLDAVSRLPGLRFFPEVLPYHSIQPETGTIVSGGEIIPVDGIVFCEGIAASQNPWFGTMPILPLKGQVLEISMPELNREQILVGKVFALHTGDGKWVCGSTYERNFADAEPTPQGIAEILGHLAALTPVPPVVLSARAALRPTTPDRRPYVGGHPTFRKLFTINGLGTKGVLLAPWCAEQLCSLLSGKIFTLSETISPVRFGEFR